MTVQTIKMVKLTINGQEVSVPAGTLLIEAAKQVGVQVPHFCYHPKLTPDANCRMCLVEIEKLPKLQTACSTPVSEGMVVQANSSKVMEARSGVMEFILSSHPLDCPICDQGGECHLQDHAHEYGSQYSRFKEQKRTFEKEYFGPVIEKEMNRCIQCMRCVRYCDEVIDSNALKGMDRGNMTQPGTFMRRELECEFCGGCIQICPVGALTSRVAMYDYRPWQLKKIETICPHCADGCLMKVESRDEKVMRITSEHGTGRNNGDLCAKGFFGYQFINHPKRLTQPLMKKADPHDRQAGQLVPVSWYEALPEAATRLAQVKARYGGSAIGGIITSRCTNEDAFVFQKFMRLVLGSNHIDSSARLGHMNAVKALGRVIGTARMMSSYEDVVQADLLLLIGADVTETNPILGLKVKEAVRQQGARLITIGPFQENPGTYVSNIVNRSDLPLRVRIGTEGMAIRGLMKAAFDMGHCDSSLMQKAPHYADKLKKAAAALSYEEVEKITDLTEAQLRDVVSALADSKRSVILAGEELVRAHNGYLDLINLCDLAILMGKINGEGCGVNVLCKEANEQGVVEMGAAPEYLPGLREIADPSSITQYVSAWKDDLVLEGGATLLEMIQRARRGQIKALYLVGADPLSVFPESAGVREALGRLELLICQDLFLTETGKLAHLILPACSFAEKDGSFTNQEGRVQKVNRAIEPAGEAKADWEIFSELSREFQYPLEYQDAHEVFSEIVRLVPHHQKRFNVDAQKKERQACLERYLAEGYLEDFEQRYGKESKDQMTDPAYPFILALGPTLFHSGRLSLQSDALLKISPEGLLQMNPKDADALGIKEGQRVRLRSSRGTVEVRVHLNQKIADKTLYFPEVFAHTGVKELFPLESNPVSGVPYFKTTSVAIERM
jgi:formate dehydrogenase alpha subunit